MPQSTDGTRQARILVLRRRQRGRWHSRRSLTGSTAPVSVPKNLAVAQHSASVAPPPVETWQLSLVKFAVLLHHASLHQTRAAQSMASFCCTNKTNRSAQKWTRVS